MSSFGYYMIGLAVVLIGLVWAAVALKADGMWIAVGVLVVAGLGMMSAAKKTKRPDPPS